MSLVEFQDLPDTTTPVNATNLNNNFKYLDKKAEIYSTDEVKTRKVWMGKPVYRKVVVLTASTTTQSISVSSVSSNIDKIWIDLSNSFYSSGGIISDWEVSGARFKIVVDSGDIYYVCSSNLYANASITFEYTKTTD